MRILFVTPNPPSPIRVRPYHFVRALAARGHRVTLAAPCAGPEEEADIRALRELGFDVISDTLPLPRRARNLAAALSAGVPLQSRYAWQPGLSDLMIDALRTLRARGQPFDLVHVEHLRASEYALRLKPHLPVVWDSVDSITDLFEQARAHAGGVRGRLITALDLARTRRHEGWLAGQFDHVVVTSEHDRAVLAALRRERAGGAPPIAVIPNGVDLAYFTPSDQSRDAETILFSGKLSYHANVAAARHLVDDIMPLVWAWRPAARVVLAGAAPAREVRRMAERHAGRVELTGTVPDLRPWLRRATLAVAPMVYAVGIQNKVLEAMATATPVIATPIALRALGAAPDRDVLAAADPPAFARAILALLDDPARAAALGRAGRAYAERRHDWDSAAACLESVYRAAVQHHRQPRENLSSAHASPLPHSGGDAGSPTRLPLARRGAEVAERSKAGEGA